MRKAAYIFTSITKRQINVVARTITILLMIPLVLSAGLLVWGLASGGWIFGLGIAAFVLAPISIEAINKLYPGKDLPLLVKILEVTFLAWFVLNILNSSLPHSNSIIFWILIGLYVLIICMAVARIARNIKEGDVITRGNYIASIVVVLILLGVALTFVIRADQESRRNFATVSNASMGIIGKVDKLDVVLQTMPVRGVPIGSEHGLGNGLLDEANNCGSDVNCPQSTRSLLIQLKRGDEDTFMKQFAQSFTQFKPDDCLGFDTGSESAMCYAQFSQNGYYITVSLDRADPYHHGAPDPAEGEKVWRYLVVTVYR